MYTLKLHFDIYFLQKCSKANNITRFFFLSLPYTIDDARNRGQKARNQSESVDCGTYNVCGSEGRVSSAENRLLACSWLVANARFLSKQLQLWLSHRHSITAAGRFLRSLLSLEGLRNAAGDASHRCSSTCRQKQFLSNNKINTKMTDM